jgi:predicted nucleic acid-binding protein
MRAAVDTNILVYAVGEADEARYLRSIEILDALSLVDGVIPAQTLAECHRVLTRKCKRTAVDAEHQIRLWSDAFEIAPTTATCLLAAAALSSRHRLQIFDAIILNAAAEAGCRVLFSEDMQHEAVFNGVTIINPFADERHPLLLAALKLPKGGPR